VKVRRSLVKVLFLAGLLSVPLSAFSLDLFLPTQYESIYGIWVNPDTDSWFQKVNIWNWGLVETYSEVGDSKPWSRETMIMLAKWKDAEGATWYRTYEKIEGAVTPTLYLYKVSQDGKMLESIHEMYFSSADEAKMVEANLSSDNPHYAVFRKK